MSAPDFTDRSLWETLTAADLPEYVESWIRYEYDADDDSNLSQDKWGRLWHTAETGSEVVADMTDSKDKTDVSLTYEQADTVYVIRVEPKGQKLSVKVPNF